jgi:hypothetical protein
MMGQVCCLSQQSRSVATCQMQCGGGDTQLCDPTVHNDCLILLIPNGMLTVNSPPAHGGIEVAATGRAAWEPSEECA